MSEENVDLVRRTWDELGTPGRVEEVEQRLSDEVLGEFFDPEIEWVAVEESLLAVDSYRGYEGLRRFWTELLSMWDEYGVESQDAIEVGGDQVAVVFHVAGRTHGVEVDATWSSLCTLREGRIVRVQNFTTRDGALEAAGLSE